jgi:hypothetical protein
MSLVDELPPLVISSIKRALLHCDMVVWTLIRYIENLAVVQVDNEVKPLLSGTKAHN